MGQGTIIPGDPASLSPFVRPFVGHGPQSPRQSTPRLVAPSDGNEMGMRVWRIGVKASWRLGCHVKVVLTFKVKESLILTTVY